MIFPDFFVIEITNRCNLLCPACPWHTCMTRPIKDMTYKEFKLVFNKIKPYAKAICLYLMGEPFLNKDLKKIIAYIKSYNIKVILSSNGMLIKENIHWIKNSKIDYLQIALDGFTKSSHESYRVGSDFYRVVEGLKLLSECKKEYLKNTEICIQTLITKCNEHEIPFIKKFAKDLGFTFHTKKMHYGRTDELRKKNMSKFKPTDKYNIRELGKNFYFLSGHCPELDKAVILSNGMVVSCCIDYDSKNNFGNIKDKSFEEIWLGEKRKSFIIAFNNKTNSFCSKCDMIY